MKYVVSNIIIILIMSFMLEGCSGDSSDGNIQHVSTAPITSIELPVLDDFTVSVVNTVETGFFYSDFFAGFTYDIALSQDGTKAYLANWNEGLVVLDTTNPLSPSLLYSDEYMNEAAQSIILSQDETTVYIGTTRGIVIKDVSNSKVPVVLGEILDLDGAVRNLAISKDGTKAFLAKSQRISGDSNGFVIVDLTTISTPTILSDYTPVVGNIGDVTLSEDETKAFVLNSSKLLIFSIIDAAAPVLLSELQMEGYLNEIVLSPDEKKAYIVNSDYGLQVINIEELESPSVIGSMRDYMSSGWKGITLSSNSEMIYMTSYEELLVIDVNSPTLPILVSRYDTAIEDPDITDVQDITLSADNKYAYISNGRQGVQILALTQKRVVGQISVISDGGSKISSFTLSGTGYSDFNIDEGGTITLNNTLSDVMYYKLLVSATNELGESNLVNLNITVGSTNLIPSADGGTDKSVNTLDTVTLSGSESSDGNDDGLTYFWRLISKPLESVAILSDNTTEETTFTADIDGTYVFGLIVNDGQIESVEDTVTITAGDFEGPSRYVISKDLNNKLYIEKYNNYGLVVTEIKNAVYKSTKILLDGDDNVLEFEYKDDRVTLKYKGDTKDVLYSGEAITNSSSLRGFLDFFSETGEATDLESEFDQTSSKMGDVFETHIVLKTGKNIVDWITTKVNSKIDRFKNIWDAAVIARDKFKRYVGIKAPLGDSSAYEKVSTQFNGNDITGIRDDIDDFEDYTNIDNTNSFKNTTFMYEEESSDFKGSKIISYDADAKKVEELPNYDANGKIESISIKTNFDVNGGYDEELVSPQLCTDGETKARECSIENGLGFHTQTCLDNSWIAQSIECVLSHCNTGYIVNGNMCVLSGGDENAVAIDDVFIFTGDLLVDKSYLSEGYISTFTFDVLANDTGNLGNITSIKMDGTKNMGFKISEDKKSIFYDLFYIGENSFSMSSQASELSFSYVVEDLTSGSTVEATVTIKFNISTVTLIPRSYGSPDLKYVYPIVDTMNTAFGYNTLHVNGIVKTYLRVDGQDVGIVEETQYENGIKNGSFLFYEWNTDSGSGAIMYEPSSCATIVGEFIDGSQSGTTHNYYHPSWDVYYTPCEYINSITFE